jgi:hypothetical protein
MRARVSFPVISNELEPGARRRAPSWWTVVALALVASACGGRGAQGPVGVDDRPAGPRPARRAADSIVSGYLVASVGGSSLGPFFARRGEGSAAAGLVAWVTPAEGAGRRVLVVPVGPKGPTGGESVAANVSIDTTSLVVGPLRGPAPGFVVAWTSLTDRGESVWAVAVNDDGAPRTKPIELTRSNDDVVWIDVVPTPSGALCLWAEETRDSGANLTAAAIDPAGKVHGAATRVARGIAGWHAIELPDGVGVSTVEPATAPKAPSAERRGGTLSFQRLDASGHATAAPVVVTSEPSVSGDVDVAREPGGRIVFAWTDRGAVEPKIMAAALDRGALVEPRPVVEARGGAALLGVASGPAGTALLFEAPARRKGDRRRVHVGRLGAGLGLTRPLSLDVLGRAGPELAATTSGFSVLATAADCEQGEAACLNADTVATMFRTDADGALVQREPLTFLSDPATSGWGMTCEGDTCFALAVSPGIPGTPARVRAVAVRQRADAKAAPPAPASPPRRWPRAEEVTAIASGESVVGIAAAHVGEALLVATLAWKQPGEGAQRSAAEDPRLLPVTLATRALGEDGQPEPPSVISTRALVAGGVAIAPAGAPEDGGAIAWVARDGGHSQVHVARINERGRRAADVQLTTARGDATDVTITWANGGWIVAWVDGRDGNGEVYATRLSKDLSRVAREERVTRAPGDASDLVALASGDLVWLAWADSRESPKEGAADIYVSAVKMKDARPAIDEQRVLPTAAHSRTPQLARGPGGLYVAWIEEAPMGSETPHASGYGAFWAKLDASGRPEGKPARVALAGEGAATSVAIEAAPTLRAVVARSTPEAIAIDAVEPSTPTAATLLVLDGPPSLDVALVLDRGVLFFNDDGPRPADRRARRAKIAWQPD